MKYLAQVLDLGSILVLAAVFFPFFRCVFFPRFIDSGVEVYL